MAVAAAVVLTKQLKKDVPQKTLVDKDVKYKVKLAVKKVVNHDTRIFRFELPSTDHVLGLPTGQHVYLSATINGSLVVRPYTPISSDDDKGYMDLLIKVYFKNTHPKFPEGGKMTQYLDGLKIGEAVDVRGPNGLLVYEGKGTFKIQPSKTLPAKEHKYGNLCMIAGGSGITPVYQLVKHILKDDQDKTLMWLVYANRTEGDILAREELDDLSQKNPDRFRLWYTIDSQSPDWKYGTGHVNAEMLSAHLCPPAGDVIVAMCGPAPMVQLACQPALDQLGYSQEQRFVF